MVLFEMHDAKKCCYGSAVAPQTPIPLYPTGQERSFWIPMMVGFELHNDKILFVFCSGAPQTRTAVPYWPPKVFSDTWDGGV